MSASTATAAEGGSSAAGADQGPPLGVLTLGLPEEPDSLNGTAIARPATKEAGEDSGPFAATRKPHMSWHRDFRLLMAGSFISMLGSRISTISFPLLTLLLTNSPVDAGLVAFAATIPSALVYIPAGALVDRWNPWRAMLICESGRGVAVAVVTISLIAGKPSIFLLIPVVILEEVLEVFSTLAERRCARNLVPQDQVGSAQASIETKTHVVVLVGRPLGVLLFSLKPIIPFLTDAASFVISGFFIATLKDRHPAPAGPRRISGRQLSVDIITALKVLLKDGYARAALALSAGTTLIGQALIMIFLASARTSELSSFLVGLVLAASGAGGILGAVSARLRVPFKFSLVLFQMLAWFAALAGLAVWGWRSLPCMAAAMGLLSLTGALGNIEMDTYLFKTFDENMLAKVTSFGRLIAYTASAIGPVLGGMLIQLCNIREAISVLAAISLALGLLASSVWSLRNYYEDIRLALNIRNSLRKIAACLRHLGVVGTRVCAVFTTKVGNVAVGPRGVVSRVLTAATLTATSYAIVLPFMSIVLIALLACKVSDACLSGMSRVGNARPVSVASPNTAEPTYFLPGTAVSRLGVDEAKQELQPADA